MGRSLKKRRIEGKRKEKERGKKEKKVENEEIGEKGRKPNEREKN